MPKSLLPLLAILAVTAAAQSYSVQGANQLAAAKDWKGLLQYAKGWTESQPANAAAWYALGNAYATGFLDYASAPPAYEHAVALNAVWGEAWNALGCAYALAGDSVKAAPAFQHAVDAEPHNPAYWNHLQASDIQLGNLPAAREVLIRAVEASGPYAGAYDWYVFGNAYLKLAMSARAIELYDKAVAMDTRLAAAYNNRGAAEQEEGQWSAALSDYQRAAGLGDELGTKNAAALQEAIDELRRQKLITAKVAASDNAIRTSQVRSYMHDRHGAAHTEANYTTGQAAR